VTEALAVRADAQILVAAHAGRLGDDLDLTVIARQFDHRLALRVDAGQVERLAVDATCVHLLERPTEPAQVLLAQRGRDVEAFGQLIRPLDDARETSDHDEEGPGVLELTEDRVGVEALPAHDDLCSSSRAR